jgi:hypothetical protein
LCPVRDVAHLTHGQVIEVLVANRLARALDAIAPELERITGSVGAAAISEFGWTAPGCTGT